MRISTRLLAATCVLVALAALAACSTAPAPSNAVTATTGVASDAGGGGGTTPTGGADGSGSTATGGGGADAGAEADAAVASPAVLASFETEDTSQYLSDSAGTLTADGASAGTSQTFALTDLNGGALASGDAVYLSMNGAYLSAANGGGGALSFVTSSPGNDETFLLVRIAGAGAVAAGDQVALQTKVTGNYVSAINGGGGQVLANAPWDKAWETYTLGLAGTAAADGGAGAPQDDAGSSPALTARQNVLAFLNGISGKQTAIGVEDKSGGEDDSNQMSSMAGDGKTPSFWSADWGFGSAAQPSSRASIVQEGEKQWGQGAIVQYIYHACPLSWGSNEEGCDYSGGSSPIDGSCGDLSDAQWSDLTTAGGTLNGVWLARLDTIAAYFQELKDAGVAPLFRPLHEINGSSENGGCWAWWQGHPGPTGSALLYQITHDYLVKTKGLDNIIWVWNLQDYTTLASDVNDYTPGASYFDIAALDVYDAGYTSGNYDAMVGAAAGKPIGVAECANLPYPDTLTSQPLWTYVAVWPDFLYSPYQSYNSAQIPQLFADSQVITLSGMPGWK